MVNNQYVMSQVKKLQTGGSSPKTYGHLIVDGIDYGNSEELYNAFANHARNQGLNQGEFYDQWLTALRNGQDVVFGNGNTVNMQPKDMSEKRAGKRSGWTKFWDDTFDTRRNHFSDAIATARGFTFTPKTKEEVKAPAKTDFDVSELVLDYNPDSKKKGRQNWSESGNLMALKRVADAINWMTNPEGFNYNDNDRIAAAYAFAKQQAEADPQRYANPQSYADSVWNLLRGYTGPDFKEKDVADALDWLGHFGIVAKPIAVETPAVESASGRQTTVTTPTTPTDSVPSVTPSSTSNSGNSGQGTQIVIPAQSVVATSETEKPTLITPEMATQLGLGDEYRFGLIYGADDQGNPVYYKNTYAGLDPRLVPIMRQVESINNRTDIPQSERYKLISDVLNIPGIDLYADWTPDYTVKGLDFDEALRALGITSAAATEVTPQYDLNGQNYRGFKYFNNSETGTNPWGFRSPYYIWFDNAGQPHTDVPEDNFNRTENPSLRPDFIKRSQYYNPVTRQISRIGRDITEEFNYIDKFATRTNYGGGAYEILSDLDNNYYIYDVNSRHTYRVPLEFVQKIRAGYSPAPEEIYSAAGYKTYTGKKEKGGKVDFNKVNAFAKGGKVVKAASGFSQAMWDLVKGMNYSPSGTSTLTTNTGYNPAEATWTITNGRQDTSLVTNTLNNQRALNTEANLSSINNPHSVSTMTFHDGKIRPREGIFGDPNYNSTPAWISLINSGLGALDYGSMAWGRHKVHDQIEKGLKDSLYKRVTPRLQGITDATPIEDAAVSRYDQYVQRGLTTPLTSDNVTNTQNVLTLQANALQGRDQAVRQQSATALQRQMQNQQIANQQNSIDADAENDFRARLSGLRMNLAQNDASLTAQTAQSIQNLAREWRTRFDQQTAKYNQLQYNRDVQDATSKYDRLWLQDVQNKYKTAWNAWNAVEDKSKYGNDFNTWAQSTTGMWNPQMETDYNTNRSNLSKQVVGYYKNWNLDPSISWIYRDRYGVPVKKSGGTLTIKQRNRYKNEPWEDIWINQNKATHKLVAKLNDNIIKTFLKTLK